MLKTIIDYKKKELEKRKVALPLSDLEKELPSLPPTIPIYPRFQNQKKIQLIAEVKKASPSKGVIRPNFDPVTIARTYEQKGAAAISVLTDENFFQGSLDYLRAVRSCCHLPLLRKDFIFDPYQVVEARVYGADFILLIAAILSPDQIRNLAEKARKLSLGVLLEVHDKDDIKKALLTEPAMIGINNRNLKTFSVDIQTTLDLLPLIPKETIVISESGIHSREDILKLENAGVDGLLIGEAFMGAEDIGKKVSELMGL